MNNPYPAKNRFKKLVRRNRKSVVIATEQVEQEMDRLVFRRLGKFANVRRFVIGWTAFIILLIVGVGVQARSLSAYYQRFAPARGGTFREGVIGSFTNANPLYATGSADATISHLIFSSLLTFDKDNQLKTDLAENWKSDDRGQVYTVALRRDVLWHDGTPLTAKDVLFTYAMIQNPDSRSPLFSSWQGVQIQAPDDYTVVFTLPSPLVGFQYSLVNGIVPQHALKDVEPSQLRSTPFNTIKPVGTGPFRFASVEVLGGTTESREEQVALSAYDKYHLGRPALDGYILRSFRDQNALAQAFADRELNAAIGLTEADVLPDDTITRYNIPLTSAVMVFMNNSVEFLADVKVRQALAHATDTKSIVQSISYPLVPVRQPFLRGQPGYDATYNQREFNIAEANRLLDEAGWIRPSEKEVRGKDGKQLKLRLFSQSLAEYAIVVQKLQQQWEAVGVGLDVFLQPEEDLQTGAISRHDYDVLLYGISIGADSDVFAYWHSSQADPRSQNRLNLSEFKNKAADTALEAGRTRTDSSLRAVKYRPFLEAWKNEAPAIGLYQPRFYYMVRGDLMGFEPKMFNAAYDRFSNVHNWMIRQEKTLR